MTKKCLSLIFLYVCFGMLTVSNANAEFGLMLGSFRNLENAEKYMTDFRQNNAGAASNVFVEESRMQGTGVWYRVCIGPFADKGEALRQKGVLDTAGVDSVLVFVQSKPGDLPATKRTKANIPQQTRKSLPPLISADASSFENVQHVKKENSQPSLDSGSKVFSETSASSTKHKDLGFSGDTLLAAGDIVQIEVPGQKEMSQAYDVDPDGNIFMVAIGKIEAAGLTIDLLQKKLTKLVKQFITRDEFPTVQIMDQLRFIHIQGGVSYPGWYKVPRVSKLDELINFAGGLVSGVDQTKITLKRRTETGYRELKVGEEILLDPNDVLSVPSPKEFKKKIDSGDLLFINIPKASNTSELTDMERRVVQNQIEVDKNGYIYIPDYGHLYANNRFPEEVAQILVDRLPKYLASSAKVHVSIIEKRHYVQILGHVRTPGWYNIPETSNIQSALSVAGGAVDGAIMSRIAITRKWGNLDHRLLVNLYQFTITGDIRLLTPIHEGDTLFVPISSSFGNVKRTLSNWEPPPAKLEEDTGTKVRIFGAVLNPGTYESKEDMDILDLLITAGGNRDDADLSRVLLIRENKSTSYDFNTLIMQSAQGTMSMPKVQNGDSLYIPYVKKSGYEKQEPKKMVRIFGGVKAPGIYDPIENMNLMDIFALAKGGTYDADLAKVMISRRDGTFIKFDMQEFLDSKNPDPTKLPLIYESDTVFVAYLQHLNLEKKEPVYVLGKVENPGQYDLAEGGMTVFQMLAYAGGLEEWADTDNILIIRNISGRQQNIPFNFRKAISGKSPELNIRLQAFDTLYVP